MKNEIKNETITKLRTFAILLVVIGHSIIIFDPNWGIYTTDNLNQIFYILKQFINLIQMPMFIIISGYLFYNTCKKYTFINIIIEKFKRIIIPIGIANILRKIKFNFIIGEK